MSPSWSLVVPMTRVELSAASSSPAVSRTVWIAGPPMFRRAMIRMIRAGPAPRGGVIRRSGAAIAPQPFDGPLDALLHPDDGLVAQQRLGLGDVGLRMEDVPGPRLVVDRGQILAQVGADELHQPVERD